MAETVKLGGREYNLARLPLRQASAMRRKINEQLEPIAKLAESAPDIEIRDVKKVSELIDSLRVILVNSIDVLFELLCEYSEDIKKDKDLLLDNAYDDEVIQAAIVMIQQLFPFGNLLSKLSGLAENMTSTSSPSTTVSTVTKPS